MQSSQKLSKQPNLFYPSQIPAGLALLFIRLYQKTWFLRQPSCRFYPSCSQYMATSVQRFGVFRGVFMGSSRLMRCHPWHPGGVDQVPDQVPVQLIAQLAKARGNR